MNGEKFCINCPHCGCYLEVEQSYVGNLATCSCCNKKFIVDSQLSEKLENAVSEERASQSGETDKKDYPWGRSYIVMCRFFAFFTIAAVLYGIFVALLQPFEERHAELIKCEKTVAVLKAEQNKFRDDYTETARLFLTGNHDPSKKIHFSWELGNAPGNFNQELMSLSAVKQSQETLLLYNKNIVRMSDEMKQFFARQYREIERMVNSGNAIKMSFGSSKRNNKNLSNRWLKMSFGSTVNFYNAKHSDIENLIDFNRKMLIYLDKCRNFNQLKYENEIASIRMGLDYISTRLNSQQRILTAGEAETITTQLQSKRSVTIGSDQFKLEKKILERIQKSLDLLSSYESWTITKTAEKLNEKLGEHSRYLERVDMQFRKNLVKAFFYSFFLLVFGLLGALVIMASADFLCAHFDTSVSLKEIKNKMKVFLLLPLFALLSLTGCGEPPAPEECFKKELPLLINTAVDSILAEKIAENRDATSYVVSGKELIVITGGKRISVKEDIGGLETVALASYYNAQYLICSATASYSPMQTYNKAPYTQKISIDVSISYIVKSSSEEENGVPGVICHFIVPESCKRSNSERQQWLTRRFKMMPETLKDHAIVIRRIARSTPVTYSEYKNFTACFNSKSKKWELEKVNKIAVYTPPPLCTEIQLEQFMEGFNFKSLVSSISGERRIFWMLQGDYDTAFKTWNQGLLNDNGVWKRKEIVLNTRAVKKATEEWERKSRPSLEELGNFLQTIKKNPEAENRQKAITIAKNALLNVFLKISDGPDEEDRQRLISVLKFIQTCPSVSVIDRNNAETVCKEQLNSVERKIREKAEKAKRFRNLLFEIDMTIKLISSGSHTQKNILELERCCVLFNKKSLTEAFNQWKIVAEIMQNQFAFLSKLYYSKEYGFLKSCSRCRGSGIKNCLKCDNTGRCSKCHGYGQITVRRRLAAKRKYGGPKTDTFSCSPKCDACKGGTLACPVCYKGYVVDIDKLKREFNIRLATLKNIVTAELSRSESQ